MTMPTMTMQDAHDEAVGDGPPELVDKPKRRSFAADYKLRILAEYDACVGDGDKGALLRREGLYSSHIIEWRRARDAAAVSGLQGPRRAKANPDTVGLEKAKKRIERLEEDLRKHRLALDIAGKALALLEMLSERATDEPGPASEGGRRPKR